MTLQIPSTSCFLFISANKRVNHVHILRFKKKIKKVGCFFKIYNHAKFQDSIRLHCCSCYWRCCSTNLQDYID